MLVDKLNTVHNDPKFMTVWESNQYRNGPYNGPTYHEELRELEKLVCH